MTAVGSPDYELMTEWPDKRRTYESRNGARGGIRLKEKTKQKHT